MGEGVKANVDRGGSQILLKRVDVIYGWSLDERRRGVCLSPFQMPCACRWVNHWDCHTWPMWRQSPSNHSYLPSITNIWLYYQIILLDDSGKLPHKIHLFASHSCKKSFTAWTTANIRAHISVCVSVNTWTKTTPRTFTRIVRISVNGPLHDTGYDTIVCV